MRNQQQTKWNNYDCAGKFATLQLSRIQSLAAIQPTFDAKGPGGTPLNVNRRDSSIQNALGTSYIKLPERLPSQSFKLSGEGSGVERPSNTMTQLTVAPGSSTSVTSAGVLPSEDIVV